MKKFSPAVAAAGLCFSAPAMAEDGTLGDCVKAALAKQKGDFVSGLHPQRPGLPGCG
ncbi:MAG: hypothetical protein ACREYF_28450 [Gammaproteobacteria bacterium]